MNISLQLQRAEKREGDLFFDSPSGFTRALEDGCFLLKIPFGLDIGPGLRLAREFYHPADGLGFSGYADGGDNGVYFDREHFQTEHILADKAARGRLFPQQLRTMCDEMDALALFVLRLTLRALSVPEALWSCLTSGAIEGRGAHWFACSHYRVERDQLGCAPHKDTGFVTILYIDQEGLEAEVEGDWLSIDPAPGYFVVNYGGAFELLTSGLPRPVRAIHHRVRKCCPQPAGEDRFSFAAFANPPATGDLHRIFDDHRVEVVQSVESFLEAFNKTTWNDRHDDFGIIRDVVASEPNAAR